MDQFVMFNCVSGLHGSTLVSLVEGCRVQVMRVRVGVIGVVQVGAHRVVMVVAHVRRVEGARAGADRALRVLVRMIGGHSGSAGGGHRRGAQLLVNG